MKIFWSWQSDTPGKIGRFLIRDALKGAIDQLKQSTEIEEPTREALHVDQDIQDVTGSPDLARTIFEKIGESEVMVADVTPIGSVSHPDDTDGKTLGKKLINSNVAIELGYALHALTDRKVLLVLNTYYGRHEDLPFDLRHKGGSITFNLAPVANPQDIQEQKKRLKERFVGALKPYVEKTGTSAPSLAFPETPATFTKAAYFKKGEVLAKANSRRQRELTYSYDDDSLCYLRIIPNSPLKVRLPLAMLKDVAHRAPLFTCNHVVLADHNEYGAIGFAPAANLSISTASIEASTQLFENGEVWSVGAGLIKKEPAGEPSGSKYPYLPTLLFEQLYYDTLRSLVDLAGQHLGVGPACRVELGLVGTKGIWLPVTVSQATYWWGPILKPEIVHRATLTDADPVAFDSLLLDFFSLVYDASSNRRPNGLCGFPPGRPGSSR
jgi:hypothetical protein